MATVQIIDGVSAAFNFQTDTYGADVNQSNNVISPSYPSSNASNYASWSCVANYCSVDLTQELLDRTTFCTAGWKGRFAALKDLMGRVDGFMSQGSPISNPAYMFGTTKGIPLLATFNTGCMINVNAMCSRWHGGLRAQSNSEMGMEWAQDSTYLSPSISWA
jgi:hypothetical protein